MAETLGSLCDKLTIVKLKQYHSDDPSKLRSLDVQQAQLEEEINGFVGSAVAGLIPIDRLTFDANKVYKAEGNDTRTIDGTLGHCLAELAQVNCELWHEQEKVYDFEQVAVEDKNAVIRRLAVLNLERNQCIDAINNRFREVVAKCREE